MLLAAGWMLAGCGGDPAAKPGFHEINQHRFFVNSLGMQFVQLPGNDIWLSVWETRVAGCVGEFWTHLSLAHLFEADATTEARLLETGVRFGKGLQLVNILRDIPVDLRMGRCYLPSAVLAEHDLTPRDLLTPETIDRFRPVYDSYLDKAAVHLDAAVEYIGLLPYRQFRLRAASMLPVLIGQRTLALLRGQNVLDAENRIKVSRPEIKQLTRQTALAVPSWRRSQKLLDAQRHA